MQEQLARRGNDIDFYDYETSEQHTLDVSNARGMGTRFSSIIPVNICQAWAKYHPIARALKLKKFIVSQ